MVHPSSRKTPNNINGDGFIFGKMWICLALLIIIGIQSVAMYEYYIVLPSCSLSVILFDINIGSIVVVACFDRCIFAPESEIARVLILGELSGGLIKFIKLILWLLISILLIIAPNCHSHPFFDSDQFILVVVLFLMAQFLG